MINLTHLHINNFAIIKEIAIDFQKGFTVVTGETGTGKSIIINALNLALGEKAEISKIRAGAESATIECRLSFNERNHRVFSFLNNNQIPIMENEIVLKRELFSTGRSRAWINNKSCPINTLKEAGNFLIDLHGQHSHQSLLKEESHLYYLDAFGTNEDLLQSVNNLWHALVNLKECHKLLLHKKQTNKEKNELWQFQLNEIKKIAPKEGEYKELVEEKKILENAEKIYELVNGLTSVLYEGDETYYANLQEVNNKLNTLNDIKPSFTEYMEKINEARYLFEELSKDLTKFKDNTQFDPMRLETVNQRLFSLQQLMKKYGSDLKKVLEYEVEIKGKINAEHDVEHELSEIQDKIDKAVVSYSKAAQKLSNQRKKQALVFQEKIEKILDRLGIIGAQFKVNIRNISTNDGLAEIDEKKYEGDHRGIDRVIFEVSTNPGEPIRPLVNIVSGGEVSRIMLAMKAILAGKDQIPIMIFDEIDTGISGAIASIVGEEIKKLANAHQIICITHLPQIAGLGNDHLCVTKTSDENRSSTAITRLNNYARIQEIAKLIGGKEVSNTAIQQAKELIE